MAIATRPKPKVQHRKRAAKHHKQTPHYLKTYWPYLPIVGVLVIGATANHMLYKSDALFYAGASLQGAAAPTRIEAMTGNTNGLALGAVIIVAAIAMAVLLFRHWYRIQRTLNRGEAFVAKHPLVDLVLVALVTAGVLLSREVI